MKKEQIKIKGTGIRCKGAELSSFNRVPDDIFPYVELGLISGNELTIWIKLLQFDSDKYGYAYPNIEQLMLYCNLGRSTIIHGIDNLCKVGLLAKEKQQRLFKKNVYYVYQPLSKEQLYSQVSSKLVEKFTSNREDLYKSYQETYMYGINQPQ